MANEYDLPPDLMAAQQQLNRQQKMAELLMAQNTQPQGQIISGRYVAPAFTQMLQPVANMLTGAYLAKKGDERQSELAKQIRDLGAKEAEQIFAAQRGTPARSEEMAGPAYQGVKPSIEYAAQPGSNEAAYAAALRGYTPVAKGMADVLGKRLLEGPKWEKAVIPMSDGSEKHGWVNYASPNPLATFVEGGTKPAYNALEGAKFTYETGMQPPGAPTARPVQGAPVQPGMPVQPLAPTGNVVGAQAMPMSTQTGNQPITATGNTVPVSAMNRPGMSPKDVSDANKAVFVEGEKGRQADLKALPGALEQANVAIKTIDEMIGDARLNDKGEIVYQKYDPVSKKYVEGKKPHGGFENYVGATMFPGLRFIEGTETASFEPLYKGIKGQAFLDAFQRLKGGGQITEVEGQKATEALLKLDKAQNEKDFIKYAREFQENLQRGMELAKNKAGVSKDYRSPVNQPALRWNPQTNSWVNQ